MGTVLAYNGQEDPGVTVDIHSSERAFIRLVDIRRPTKDGKKIKRRARKAKRAEKTLKLKI